MLGPPAGSTFPQSTMKRPLVLDVTPAFADGPGASAKAARALGENACDLLVRTSGRRLVLAAPPRPPRSAAPPAERAAERRFADLRKWIIGDAPPVFSTALMPKYGFLPSRALIAPAMGAPRAPADAVFVTLDWRSFANPGLQAWLEAQVSLRVLAVPLGAWALDFPEYLAREERASFERAIAAALRRTDAFLAPDSACAARLKAQTAQSPRRPDVPTVQLPSDLASSQPAQRDGELAESPYVVAVGPIDARANILLLLQGLRDLVAHGDRPPKLVLVGKRGRQIEQVAPMLDWCEAIRPFVAEAPDLDADGLRKLIFNARALVAPAFAASEAALLRDVQMIGTPVIASDIPSHRDALGSDAELLHPLDGVGWREAIRRSAQARPAAGPDAAALRQWSDWLLEFGEYVASL